MITFLPDDKKVPERVGETIYDVALEAGVNINSLCGGRGTCGKCKVIIKAGNRLLGDITEAERSFLNESDVSMGYRLACQARVISNGPLMVLLPSQTKSTTQRLQVEGLETEVALSPSLRKISLKIVAPTLEDPRSDLDSILRSFPEVDKVGLPCLRSLSSRLRENNWEVSLIMYGREMISISMPGARVLGFAVDLGSTKLAGYLLDLETGRTIAKVSKLNPQIPYGEDIVSRTTWVLKDQRNLSILRAVLLKAVNEMIDEACGNAGVSRSDVYEVVAVGNTFMHHTFLGLNPASLALAPYPPAVASSLTFNASEVGIRIGEGGKIYIPPNKAGYIGADCLADVLSTGLYKSEKPALLVDIGTNTELALNDGKEIYVASAASGPAFEGAGLLHGMRAMEGAIEEVAIERGCKNIYFSTIGN
ncbi:MAG: ASKHA domain-containing protein, partial [Conexivisphaerales archaeon]